MRAIPLPIPVARLDDLCTKQLLTDEEIAALLVSEGHEATVKRVRSWRRRYDIATVPRWARNKVPAIEGKLQSLLVGSMLGDGRLVHRTHATHYTENHAADQRAYLEWKAALWGSWAKPDAIKPVTWTTNGKKYQGFRFNTVGHADLNPWRELFYADTQKGWKRVVPEVVALVDEFALTIWYLDDGCAAWWPDITFGADPASRQVALAIFDKFGLSPRWQSKKGNTGEFHMEREDTAHRFLDIIRPHVPPCMTYKLEGFGFMGSHYEVRQKIDEETLREMAARGVPIKRMARELRVGASTVSRWLKKLDIEHPRQVGRPSLLSA